MGAYLVLCARVMLGIVLVVSVTARVRGRREFAAFTRWLGELSLIPRGAARGAAVAMTAAEVTAVALLAIPVTVAAGLAVTAGIIAVFAAATARIARRGAPVPCRCFGASRRPIGRMHVARNALLALIALTAAVEAARTGQPGLAGPGFALGAILGAAAALAIIRLDDIAGLFTPEPPVHGAVGAQWPASNEQPTR